MINSIHQLDRKVLYALLNLPKRLKLKIRKLGNATNFDKKRTKENMRKNNTVVELKFYATTNA